MLSILAAYSMYVLLPLAILLKLAGGTGVHAERLPRLRLPLWSVLALISIWAADFAVVSRFAVFPVAARLRICMFDVAVLAVPIAVGKWRTQTIFEMWAVACLVGLVGCLVMPPIGLP